MLVRNNIIQTLNIDIVYIYATNFKNATQELEEQQCEKELGRGNLSGSMIIGYAQVGMSTSNSACLPIYSIWKD